MVTITQPDDVREAYDGTIEESKDEWLSGRIAAAERMLARRLGPLDVWANTPERIADVKEVVAAMVLRLVRAHPEGWRQESETIGPTSHSFTTDPRAASATLWVTDDDWAILGLSRHSAGTVRTPLGW